MMLRPFVEGGAVHIEEYSQALDAWYAAVEAAFFDVVTDGRNNVFVVVGGSSCHIPLEYRRFLDSLLRGWAGHSIIFDFQNT